MRDYYKYYEIIIGLRNEYLKNQELLRQLEKQIVIEEDNVKDLNIISYLKTEGDPYSSIELILFLYKKQSIILNKMYHILSCANIVSDEKSHYTFDNFNSSLIKTSSTLIKPNDFNPIVKIENQNAFDDICRKIINSNFLSLPFLHVEVNDFQILNSDGKEISLFNYLEAIRQYYFMDICYNPRSDSIIVTSNRNISSYNAQQFLNTEIPKYKIHPKYIDIIESNITPNSNIHLDDELHHKKEELFIQEDGKQYNLTKKKTNK